MGVQGGKCPPPLKLIYKKMFDSSEFQIFNNFWPPRVGRMFPPQTMLNPVYALEYVCKLIPCFKFDISDSKAKILFSSLLLNSLSSAEFI